MKTQTTGTDRLLTMISPRRKYLMMSILMAFLSTGLCHAIDITIPTQYYLMHSSGLHAAKGSDQQGCLEAPDANHAQQLTFIPLDGGYFNIAAPDGSLLSLSGTYNTRFISPSTSTSAQFAIEQVDDSFIRIKCRSNGKYLGTDGIEAGNHIFADKKGNSTLHYWYLSDDPFAEPAPSELSYFINPDARRQVIEGWGVSLCWWANMCGKWDDDKIDEIVDWLVSPDGLNFNIFRYNIGGGDDPDNAHCDAHHMGRGKGLRAEMEGFKDSSDGPFIWTRDEAQRKIMLKIKEKRPDAIFEAFSNSAPWYMTYSGCVAGNTNAGSDNLKPEYYQEFAEYLVEVCKHYKEEYGIEFRTLDPFNEPMTSYWGANGGQEGCHFDVGSQTSFLKKLAPVLEASGLNTVISASDETSVTQSVSDFDAYNKAGVLPLVGQWNTHTYTADNKSRAQLSSLCREHGLRLWMSEVGAGGSGIAGNLALAQKLIDDIRHIMPQAWIDWQYIEEGNDQWCLVKAGSFANQTYSKIKNYHIRSHFSRFIKAGYTILNSFDASSLVALSPQSDELVMVILNTGATRAIHRVSLSMFASHGEPEAYMTDLNHDMSFMDEVSSEGDELTIVVPPSSVVSVVIPVQTKAPVQPLDPAQTYLILPRLSPSVALDVNETGRVIVNSLSFNQSQLWSLHADGAYHSLINGDGQVITETAPDYALHVNQEKSEGQDFRLIALDSDNVYYKILNASGTKALDLEGEKSSPGTGVGVWAYDDLAPVHRQWQFISVPSELLSRLDELTVAGDESPVDFSIIPGAVTVALNDTVPGTVTIYDTNGIAVNSMVLASDSITIPLNPGIYIVAFSGRTRTATTVLIR